MSRLNMFLCGMEGIVPLVLVVALVAYFYKKEKISFKVLGIGVLVFVVFSQVLEKLVHLFVLQISHSTSTYLSDHPIAYATYGALVAGLFEEVGRYLAFGYILRKFRAWKDGIAYGLGHGGIETLLIGTLTSIQIIVFGNLINHGQLPLLQQKVSLTVMDQIVALVHQPAYVYLLGSLERMIALAIQVALSLIVLYGVRKKNNLYLFFAIVLHAVTDFMPALYQKHAINFAIAESVLVGLSIIAILFIVKSKRLFNDQ